jgi:hypothetical protein
VLPNILVSDVLGAAHKAIVVFPTQGHRHVFGRKVVLVTFFASNNYEWKYAEELLPIRPVGREGD